MTARRAGAVLETLLLQAALQPLADDDTALGSYGIGCLAESVARNDRGFADAIAAVLERRDE